MSVRFPVVLIGFAVFMVSLTGPITAQSEAATIRRVLLYDCASEVGHRKLVFYDDGMVLLEEGEPGAEKRRLHRLDADRARGYLNRLGEVEPGVMEPSNAGPGGDWVESCRLRLGPDREWSFRRYDSLALSVARLRTVAEDLLTEIRGAPREKTLPVDYVPAPGDVLLRRDGLRFRIVRSTGDKTGLELVGLDQPLTVYIPAGGLRTEFVELLRRGRP